MSASNLPTIRAYPMCESSTEAREILAQIKRDKPAVAHLPIGQPNRSRKSLDNFPDLCPPGDTILLVETVNCIPFLRVTGGSVVFTPRSRWGNSLTIVGGEVHVNYIPDRKVTINGDTLRLTVSDRTVGLDSRFADLGTAYQIHRANDGARDDMSYLTVVDQDSLGIPLAWQPWLW